MARSLLPSAVLLSLPFTAAISQTKPTITPKDYGKWESLGAGTLSPNGQWLAYSISRVEEDGELRLRALGRDTTIVIANGGGATFTANSRWAAYTITPSTGRGGAGGRGGGAPAPGGGRAGGAPTGGAQRPSLELRDLTTNATQRIPDVTTFRFSNDGRFIAMRRPTTTPGARAAVVTVQELATGVRSTLGAVGEFVWSDVKPTLAYTVIADAGAGNGVQLFDANTGAMRPLDTSPSDYRSLSWRPKSDELLVMRAAPDRSYRDTTYAILVWSRASESNATLRTLDPSNASGFPKEMRISEGRRPDWSRDGSMIYIGLHEPERVPARGGGGADSTSGAARGRGAAPAEPVSDVQVWSAKDVRLQRAQELSSAGDAQRTLLAVWHLGDGRVVRVASDSGEQLRLLGGGKVAAESDRRPYAWGTMFGRPYQDVWLIDLKTGERRKALTKVRYFYGGNPDGSKLFWYDGKDYWTQEVASGARTNLTAKMKVIWRNPDYDTPTDLYPPTGNGGFTSDGKSVLLYDEYDIWVVALDGSGGRKLTDGAAEKLVYRPSGAGAGGRGGGGGAADEDGYDLSRAQYFTLTGKKSKQSGYARLVPGKQMERLVLEDARVSRLARADSAEVFAFTRERFDTSPNWYVTGAGGTFGGARKVSETNPFQKDYAWGRSELVNFKSTTGRDLQAALFYPANYDPSKKYPMIVYTYELLSQGVHQYVVPSERSYYNITSFTANGYLVLEPDIVFRDRDPGMSVLEAVVPAVKAIVAKGIADSAHVGHVGHSWGGYEAAFLPTRTNIFAASVAGAAITDFISFPGTIHWSGGNAEFDHWETGQGRMEVPPWEDMAAYLRNSPIAKVQDLKTPMLMEVGDADGTVEWHQGLEFYNYARRAGKSDFVLLLYPGEDHGLRKRENQIDYTRRILQWFGHYLKGDAAPSWITDGMSWQQRKAGLGGGPGGGGGSNR